MSRKKKQDPGIRVSEMPQETVDQLIDGKVDALLTPKGAQQLIDQGYGKQQPDLQRHLQDVVAGRTDMRLRVKERLPNDSVAIDMQVVPKPSQGGAFRRAPGVEHELDVMHEVGQGNVPLTFGATVPPPQAEAEPEPPEEWGKSDAIARRYPKTAERFRNGMYMPPWKGEEGSWSKHWLESTFLISSRHLRPAGLPHIRAALLAALHDESARRPAPPPIAAAEQWGMYYASADFTSLFEQMQQDWDKDEDVLAYWQDVVAEQGVSGQFVVAFDATRLPWLRFANTKDMIQNDAWQKEIDEDPWILRTDDVYVLRAEVQAISVQWRVRRVRADLPVAGALTPMEVDVYFGIYTRGHTFRTAVNGSYTSRDAILIAWMLTNPILRMLESKEVKASAGLPPKAKAAMPRKHRDAPVTVVNLRHAVRAQVKSVEHASGQGREYSHRFLVRGHWRNQACGKGWSEHRRVYVLPYVKGPDGAPFTKKEKVLKW